MDTAPPVCERCEGVMRPNRDEALILFKNHTPKVPYRCSGGHTRYVSVQIPPDPIEEALDEAFARQRANESRGKRKREPPRPCQSCLRVIDSPHKGQKYHASCGARVGREKSIKSLLPAGKQRPPWTPERIEALRDMWNRNLSIKWIAQEFLMGVDSLKPTVARFREDGWDFQFRRPGRRPT